MTDSNHSPSPVLPGVKQKHAKTPVGGLFALAAPQVPTSTTYHTIIYAFLLQTVFVLFPLSFLHTHTHHFCRKRRTGHPRRKERKERKARRRRRMHCIFHSQEAQTLHAQNLPGVGRQQHTTIFSEQLQSCRDMPFLLFPLEWGQGAGGLGRNCCFIPETVGDRKFNCGDETGQLASHLAGFLTPPASPHSSYLTHTCLPSHRPHPTTTTTIHLQNLIPPPNI